MASPVGFVCAINILAVVSPLVGPLRFGFSSTDVMLKEVAAAIEYWVKASRPAAWADTRKYANAAAARAGRPFGNWVGDPKSWATRFWQTNNHLKHEVSYAVDEDAMFDYAQSARQLLIALILNRVSRSNTPGEILFRHHRLSDLGDRLRNR